MKRLRIQEVWRGFQIIAHVYYLGSVDFGEQVKQ